VKLGDILTLVQIINGIVVILGILGTAWLSFVGRFFAGTIQISLTLMSVTKVNNTRTAIVRVQIKNLGRSRITKGECYIATKVVNVHYDYSEPINIISPKEGFNYSQARRIFASLTVIEPNGEVFEEVVLALKEPTFFTMGVRFIKRGTFEAWEAIAVFNTDESAEIPAD